jgi:hypothetical protein
MTDGIASAMAPAKAAAGDRYVLVRRMHGMGGACASVAHHSTRSVIVSDYLFRHAMLVPKSVQKSPLTL